jgi:hypothetical protein
MSSSEKKIITILTKYKDKPKSYKWYLNLKAELDLQHDPKMLAAHQKLRRERNKQFEEIMKDIATAIATGAVVCSDCRGFHWYTHACKCKCLPCKAEKKVWSWKRLIW